MGAEYAAWLAASDPNYKGRYDGGVLRPDSTYHQGTVQLRLMGPFITAYCRTQPDRDAVRARPTVDFRKWNVTLTKPAWLDR